MAIRCLALRRSCLLSASINGGTTEAIAIPTIGIGAGPHCDGQVLVLPDLLGLNDGFEPKFLKKYANMAEGVRKAARDFAADVRGGVYPDQEHSFD